MNPNTQGAALEPLITDLDIMLMLESILIDDEVINVLDAHKAMIALRDHYQAALAAPKGHPDAKIAALEAGTWQPVPDGFYPGKDANSDDFEVDGEWLRTYYKGATGWGCKIPTELGWVLCRLVAGQEGQGEAHGDE